MWYRASALLSGLVAISAIAPTHAADNEVITSNIAKLLPSVEFSSVTETPVKGLYEVVAGSQILYVSEDGRYLVQGPMIDLVEREDLTEPRRVTMRQEAMKEIGADETVDFGPEDPNYTVTVFTDITCGYCRKLHQQIDEYAKEGIRVRYAFYPRAGAGSDAYKEAIAVWCSDDRQQALTDAKAGKKIDEKTCDNPVDEHIAVANKLGIRGTPAILFEDGTMLPGYVPPKRLAQELSKSGS